MTEPEQKKRGFAAMTPEQRSAISSKGGRAAQDAGVAHRFQKGSALARESGRKGGLAKGVERGETECSTPTTKRES